MTAVPVLDRRGEYVSAVAVELADLAPDDRGELIEELDDHIAALLEDRPDADLTAELGTPRAYADELRAAAGLGAAAASRPGTREIVAAARARVTTALPWLPGLLQTLRPAWWVLRGALAAFAVDLLVGFGWRSAQGMVLLVLGVVGSLWVAQHPPRTRGLRLAVIGFDVAAVLALLWVGVAVSVLQSDSVDEGYGPTCSSATNLQPYDAAGRPLTDIRLVDQDGLPFDLVGLGCGTYDPGLDYSRPGTFPYPTLPAMGDPTGPPPSLTPLPGATVSPAASPTGSPTPNGPAASGVTTTPTR